MTVDTHTDDPLEAHNNARAAALFLIERTKNNLPGLIRALNSIDEMSLSITKTTDKEQPCQPPTQP